MFTWREKKFKKMQNKVGKKRKMPTFAPRFVREFIESNERKGRAKLGRKKFKKK